MKYVVLKKQAAHGQKLGGEISGHLFGELSVRGRMSRRGRVWGKKSWCMFGGNVRVMLEAEVVNRQMVFTGHIVSLASRDKNKKL